MNINMSKGLDLLPREIPSSKHFRGLESNYRESLDSENIAEHQKKAILWTIAMENSFEDLGLERMFPGFRYVTYGFADPEFEDDAFAILVYTSRLFSYENPIRKLTIDNYDFPIFIRPSFEILHQNVPQVNPSNGTTTCWAESNKLNLLGKIGLLTAKHLIGNNERLLPTNMGDGVLIDTGPDGIDAALFELQNGSHPKDLKELQSQNYIAQWTDVSIVGKESGILKTKVIEVTSSRGSLASPIPLRIFLAYPGQQGDSGALVIDSNGKGIGIYMGGVVNVATNHMEGFCQHLGQASYVMDLNLFQ